MSEAAPTLTMPCEDASADELNPLNANVRPGLERAALVAA